MIYYIVTPRYEHTIENYLAHWAPELKPRFVVMFYDDVLRARELPVGTYIFSDLERLLPAEIIIAERVWEQLDAAGARLLNHPSRTLRRYELLKMLYEQGRNHFRVARATDRRATLTFPVFLREEGEHGGSLTRLLENRRALDEAIVGAMLRSYRLETLLAVEYCHTEDEDGLFRKYSAFVVDGRVVPCHVDCSRQWMVKDTDVVDESIMAEELDYLRTNPNREWLEEIFRLARVDYGRIDYGLKEGAPQVWEINTNPVVILPPGHYSEIHMPVKRIFAAEIAPAFEAVDSPGEARTRVSISVAPTLLARLDVEQRRQRRHRARRRFMRRAVRTRPIQDLHRVIRPLVTPVAPLVARLGRKRDKPAGQLTLLFLMEWAASVPTFPV